MKNSIYKVALAVFAMVAMIGCRSNDVKISGRFVGLNSKMVYLEQMSASGQSIIDSVELSNDGAYLFTLNEVAPTPSLYNVIYGGERIPLLVSRGEKIELNAMGSALANYTVGGSYESELLRKFNKSYIENQLAFNSIFSPRDTSNGLRSPPCITL